ncbi:MAG TPA: DUF4276 family protein [Pyrinomonadaceae bacterium]|nr:DUF4276 family protein [Pyrinomonadaceae bacterium]
MVKRFVRVYIEGGAEGKSEGNTFRESWKKFLNELHELARQHGYHGLKPVRGKGRAETFRLFAAHQSVHPEDLCALLVDSETKAPEGSSVWNIVANRTSDNWQRPVWAEERHLYLMVHFVETWLLTDQNALQQFFKNGFTTTPLPTTNLETRSKAEVLAALKKATQNTPKGAYRHGQANEIIKIVSPEKVKT